MPIDEYTFPHFVPRLGFLLHDMDMDKGGCGKVFTLYFFAKGVYFREVKQRGTEVHLEEEHWGFKPTQTAKDPLSAYSGQSGLFQRWTGKMGTTVKTLWCLAEWKLKLLSFPPHFRCSLPGGVQSWWRVDDGRGRYGGGQAQIRGLPYLCCICQDHTHKLDYTALLSPYSHSRIAFLSRLVPKLIRGKPSRLYKWPWLHSQVQLDSQMLDDLAIDTTLLRSKITDPLNLYELIRGLVLTRFLFRDVKDRRKRLVGKLWSGEGPILDFGEYTFYRNKSLNLADDATCVTELGNLVTAVSCT